MKRLLVLAAVASSIALVAACGGATDSELFAAPGSSEFGTVPSADDPSSSTSSGSGGGSSGLPGSGSSSSTSSSGGSMSSSGGSSSGGSSGSTTDAGVSDAGSANKGIWCGEDNSGDDVYCSAGTACCAGKGPGGPSLKCSAGGGITACPIGNLAIRCDDQTDCPGGQVCCGMFSEQTGYQSIQCASSCNSVGNTIRAVRFCDPKAAVDECQAIGKTCGWSQGLPGYGICK